MTRHIRAWSPSIDAMNTASHVNYVWNMPCDIEMLIIGASGGDKVDDDGTLLGIPSDAAVAGAELGETGRFCINGGFGYGLGCGWG